MLLQATRLLFIGKFHGINITSCASKSASICSREATTVAASGLSAGSGSQAASSKSCTPGNTESGSCNGYIIHTEIRHGAVRNASGGRKI